ncbi:MAG: fructosamine kinase family protein [Alphaproteobacteria bacterium]|nr:fructosamine kinase family protein [Alphaproteobacteria bacterium]
MMTDAIRREIEEAMDAKAVSIAPLSAANNAQIYRLDFGDIGYRVAKVAEKGLDTEAFMLRFLKEKTELPVPQIDYGNEHVMIMEFIETHYSLDARAQKDAAHHLAKLHGIKGDMYGFERDTTIGSLRQPNVQSASWHAFFAEQRLIYMGRRALEEGKIDKDLMKKIEALASRLSQYIDAPETPVLVHGDVWSGNVLVGHGCIAAFLDPAIHYADPDVELAFIKLFNTFDAYFFARYNDIRPIRPGFETRADIYNIYPLLVHARLFGTSYARKAKRLVEKFV